ncbi:MAG: amidohydrolase, partial [Lentisphaerae bacterium]|nr:amidohydrolase [Lentisphaerota bacterium]
MKMPREFEERPAALLPEVIALRRDLHAHPETAYGERRTAGRIAAWLARLPGMQVREGVGGTGVVATLAAERTGDCLAFRADMDALPMPDQCGKPHASTVPGVAHACGHDGHVACLLG